MWISRVRAPTFAAAALKSGGQSGSALSAFIGAAPLLGLIGVFCHDVEDLAAERQAKQHSE